MASRERIADVLERVARRLRDERPGELLRGSELADLVVAECGCARYSVLASDHCYNRTNNGIPSDNDPMFEHEEPKNSGLYRFLGRHYPYDKPQYHYPKGGEKRVVGHWRLGTLTPLVG